MISNPSSAANAIVNRLSPIVQAWEKRLRALAVDEILAAERSEAANRIAALEDLIKCIDVHSAYPRCGYEQMDTDQKALFDTVTSKPWSFEREPSQSDRERGTQG